MIGNPYLIALALIEQDGKRALPLGGKSLGKSIDSNSNPEKAGSDLIQQLLLRIFQKSDQSPLKRSFQNNSLLLIQIPMELMQERVPKIKSEWIRSGNNEKLISELKNICENVWSITFTKAQGVQSKKL